MHFGGACGDGCGSDENDLIAGAVDIGERPDNLFHFPEIQLPVTDVAVRYDVDPVKAVQSRKFLLDYAAWRNIPVAGMHITPPGIIRVKKSGEGYVKF